MALRVCEGSVNVTEIMRFFLFLNFAQVKRFGNYGWWADLREISEETKNIFCMP